MVQQTTQGIESAIVLAPANSLDQKCDLTPERTFRASLPELLVLPKNKLLKSMGMFCCSIAARYRNLKAYVGAQGRFPAHQRGQSANVVDYAAMRAPAGFLAGAAVAPANTPSVEDDESVFSWVLLGSCPRRSWAESPVTVFARLCRRSSSQLLNRVRVGTWPWAVACTKSATRVLARCGATKRAELVDGCRFK